MDDRQWLELEIAELKGTLETWKSTAQLHRREVAELRADRAALLALWVIRNGGMWQVRSEAVPPPSYGTREEAEAAVLEWAHSRKKGTP